MKNKHSFLAFFLLLASLLTSSSASARPATFRASVFESPASSAFSSALFERHTPTFSKGSASWREPSSGSFGLLQKPQLFAGIVGEIRDAFAVTIAGIIPIALSIISIIPALTGFLNGGNKLAVWGLVLAGLAIVSSLILLPFSPSTEYLAIPIGSILLSVVGIGLGSAAIVRSKSGRPIAWIQPSFRVGRGEAHLGALVRF